MSRLNQFQVAWVLFTVAALAWAPVSASAAERDRQSSRRAAAANARTVELFSAMESGELDVKVILKNSLEGRLLIENKTDQPLSVRLPETYAAMPVAAQIGGGGGFGGGGGLGGGGGQTGGGGFGGGGGGFGGGGQFNVPAETVGHIKIATLCLEHGKDEPRAAMQYELKPLEAFSDDPKLAQLLKLFATGTYDQRAAQAAAWYVSNGMSWQELTAKEIHRAGGIRYPYFSRDQIRVAMQMVERAERLSKEAPVEAPAANDSLSTDEESTTAAGH